VILFNHSIHMIRAAERVHGVHTLARITGHKTLQMLIRYYHPRTEDLAEMLGDIITARVS